MKHEDDPLEAVLRPIVRGQLRSFAADHPEIIAAVDWYKPRTDKVETFVNSVSKRILRDLLCSDTRVRLIAAAGVTASACGCEMGAAVTTSDGAMG